MREKYLENGEAWRRNSTASTAASQFFIPSCLSFTLPRNFLTTQNETIAMTTPQRLTKSSAKGSEQPLSPVKIFQTKEKMIRRSKRLAESGSSRAKSCEDENVSFPNCNYSELRASVFDSGPAKVASGGLGKRKASPLQQQNSVPLVVLPPQDVAPAPILTPRTTRAVTPGSEQLILRKQAPELPPSLLVPSFSKPKNKKLPRVPFEQDTGNIESHFPTQDSSNKSPSSASHSGLDILVAPEKLTHAKQEYFVPKKKSPPPVKHFTLRPRKSIPGSLTNNGAPALVFPRRTKSAPMGPLRDNNNGLYMNGTPKTPQNSVKFVVPPPPPLRKSRSEGDCLPLFSPSREMENDWLLLSTALEDPTESFLSPESQTGPMEPIYLPPPPMLRRLSSRQNKEWDMVKDDGLNENDLMLFEPTD